MNQQSVPDPKMYQDGLMGVYALLQVVQVDLREHGTKLALLEADVRENNRAVENINRILKDGNGSKSLMVRIELMEQNVLRIAEAIGDVKRSLESSHTEDSKGKWSLANTIVTGILTLIAAILTAIITSALRTAKP